MHMQSDVRGSKLNEYVTGGICVHLCPFFMMIESCVALAKNAIFVIIIIIIMHTAILRNDSI